MWTLWKKHAKIKHQETYRKQGSQGQVGEELDDK
jgi:hypothetical protein